MKKLAVLAAIIVIIVLGLFFWRNQPASAPTEQAQASQSQKPRTTSQTGFNKQQYSLNQASSLWVVVDKLRPLQPIDYQPQLTEPSVPMRSNITSDEKHVSVVMAPALEAMVAAAKAQGVNLNLQSGYRSYQFQVTLYNDYVKENGQTQADTFSARPGYSEHQTGLAVDLGGTSDPACNVAQCFAGTTEGKWLATNAWQYGFILRYPQGLASITGYEFEPWHFRYIGKSLAAQMHKTGVQTLEQFFGLPAAPNYK